MPLEEFLQKLGEAVARANATGRARVYIEDVDADFDPPSHLYWIKRIAVNKGGDVIITIDN